MCIRLFLATFFSPIDSAPKTVRCGCTRSKNAVQILKHVSFSARKKADDYDCVFQAVLMECALYFFYSHTKFLLGDLQANFLGIHTNLVVSGRLFCDGLCPAQETREK